MRDACSSLPYDTIRGIAEGIVAAVEKRVVAWQGFEPRDWAGISLPKRRGANFDARLQPRLHGRRALRVPWRSLRRRCGQQSRAVFFGEAQTGQVAIGCHQVEALVSRQQDAELSAKERRLIDGPRLADKYRFGQEGAAALQLHRRDPGATDDEQHEQDQNALCHRLTLLTAASACSSDQARGSNT